MIIRSKLAILVLLTLTCFNACQNISNESSLNTDKQSKENKSTKAEESNASIASFMKEEIEYPREDPGRPFAKYVFSEKELASPNYTFTPDSWKVMDLNGVWKLKKMENTYPSQELESPIKEKELKLGYWKKDFDDTKWLNFAVPMPWDNKPEGGLDRFDGVGWYRRNFTIAPEMKEKGFILKFDSVDDHATVWVNGKKAGEHEGGFTAFEFDISDLVQLGGQNTLAVRVYNQSTDYGDTPYAPKGGIMESVKLIAVPEIYVKRILITPRLDASSIDVECLLVSRSDSKEKTKFSYKLATADNTIISKVKRKELKELDIKPGENTFSFNIKISDPIYWDTSNPHLYSLELYSGKEAISRTRFGFREFKSKGYACYLNGKRIYLTGDSERSTAFGRGVDIRVFNKNNIFKKDLLMFKKANINYIRGFDRYPEIYYRLCDELGILLIEEFAKPSPVNRAWLARKTPQITEWVYQVYNHPCVVVWDFGNELHEKWALDHGQEPIQSLLNQWYKTVKKIDKQKRIITLSSGRHPDEGDLSDLISLHFYIGCNAGRPWTFMGPYIEKMREKIDKSIGKIPMTCDESMSLSLRYQYPHASRIAKDIFSGKSIDKKKYLKLISDKKTGVRKWVTIGGAKIITDQYNMEDFQAFYTKRQMEEFRRAGDILAGFGPYGKKLDIVKKQCYKDNVFYPYLLNHKRYDKKHREQHGLKEGIYVKSPYWYMLKRCFNPAFICFGHFAQNLFSGGLLKAKVYCINDLAQPREECWVRFVIYDSTGKKSLYQEAIRIGPIAANSRKIIDYECTVPQDLPTGDYKIGLFLYDREKVISDNYQNLFIVNRKSLPNEIETKADVALYDIGEDLFGIKGTKRVLDNLKIKYNDIKGFDNLDNYDVLIIGARSIDSKVMKAGEKIREWIEKGGKLLCFEQVLAGDIPWADKYRIVEGHPGAFVDTLDCRHPVYSGLKQENFDTWNGDKGVIFKKIISPMDETVVGGGSYASYYFNKDNIQMVAQEFKLGKGTAFHSQMEATKRYGQDSAATKYIQNTLDYVLNKDTTKYAHPIELKKVKKIDPEKCLFVDLSPYVNRGFKDEVKEDKKGGWDDGGKNDMRKMPVGRQIFKGVPFEVIDPAANNDKSCIVLKGPEKRKKGFLPKEVTGIKVDKKIQSLYFLHTATYCPHAKAIGKYVIHYEDGTKVEKELLASRDIADWWKASDLKKATVGFSTLNDSGARVGVYIMEWPNPYLMKKIKSVDFISEGKAVPILIAVTGKLYEDIIEPE